MNIDMKAGDIEVGDYYEDCAYHPCVCIRVDDDDLYGISLVDGSAGRQCSKTHCGVVKISFKRACELRFYGPDNVDIDPKHRWWPEVDKYTHLYIPDDEK